MDMGQGPQAKSCSAPHPLSSSGGLEGQAELTSTVDSARGNQRLGYFPAQGLVDRSFQRSWISCCLSSEQWPVADNIRVSCFPPSKALVVLGTETENSQAPRDPLATACPHRPKGCSGASYPAFESTHPLGKNNQKQLLPRRKET